jgi:hypothetical protein
MFNAASPLADISNPYGRDGQACAGDVHAGEKRLGRLQASQSAGSAESVAANAWARPLWLQQGYQLALP